MTRRIMVVDGMGGRIGQEIVQRLRAALGESVEIIAVGTNSTATSSMLKAGANRGATGENAVRVSVREADVLIGPLSVLIPDSMMGEVTPGMAEALALSSARKVMLPLTNPRIDLVGTTKDPLPHLLEEAIAVVTSALG
jgi:NAD(P)-dependent dehydrogenase (short-subunit alcohol dehydrogenase family)